MSNLINITNLHKNVLCEIFSHFSPNDLSICKSVCKTFKKIINNNFIWTAVAKTIDFPIQMTKNQEDGDAHKKVITYVLGKKEEIKALIIDESIPEDIRVIVFDPKAPTFEEMDCLNKCYPARDTLIAWKTLKQEMQQTLPPYRFATSKEMFAKADEGKAWCRQNDLSQIDHIQLSRKALMTIPPEISKLKQLTVINLQNNKFRFFPKEICLLTQLKTLDLQNNKLTYLPEEIGQLTNLIMLGLSGNQLTFLSKELGKCVQLQALFLGMNKLVFLSKEIEYLTQLEILKLPNNKLLSLPKEIGKLIKCTNFDVSNNFLIFLPKEIGQMTALEHLNLHNNKLSILPKEILKLSHLQKLHVYKNKLSKIPKEIMNRNILQQDILKLQDLRWYEGGKDLSLNQIKKKISSSVSLIKQHPAIFIAAVSFLSFLSSENSLVNMAKNIADLYLSLFKGF